MITYQKIQKKNLFQITKIWKFGLVDNIYSVLGPIFIKEYLNLILKIKENRGFIAVDKRKKKVIGFIIFGKEEGISFKILRKNLIKIVLKLFEKFFLFKLNDLLKFIDVLIYLLFLKLYKVNFNKSTELLIIVVEKSYRSRKIGNKLINKSILFLKKENKKLRYINVVTLKRLKRSVNFYKKNKFNIKKKIFNRYHLLRKI